MHAGQVNFIGRVFWVFRCGVEEFCLAQVAFLSENARRATHLYSFQIDSLCVGGSGALARSTTHSAAARASQFFCQSFAASEHKKEAAENKQFICMDPPPPPPPPLQWRAPKGETQRQRTPCGVWIERSVFWNLLKIKKKCWTKLATKIISLGLISVTIDFWESGKIIF